MKDKHASYMRVLKMKEDYETFAINWAANHSISKAPSFSSWKEFYRNA